MTSYENIELNADKFQLYLVNIKWEILNEFRNKNFNDLLNFLLLIFFFIYLI